MVGLHAYCIPEKRITSRLLVLIVINYASSICLHNSDLQIILKVLMKYCKDCHYVWKDSHLLSQKSHLPWWGNICPSLLFTWADRPWLRELIKYTCLTLGINDLQNILSDCWPFVELTFLIYDLKRLEKTSNAVSWDSIVMNCHFIETLWIP